jgi:hypothetical protein
MGWVEIGLALVLFLSAFLLRTLPHLRFPPGGADVWFYFLYIEKLKRERKFPISMDSFLLDEKEQWYPPGFPFFLSLFPQKTLIRYHWVISPSIDLINLLILYGLVRTTTGSFIVALSAGLIYSVTPTLYTENRNLNSRSFGALLGNLTILFAIHFTESYSWEGFVGTMVFGFLTLMSHKLTTQALIFFFLFFALLKGEWIYLGLIVAIFLATFLFSLGFYYKVLLAHIDILKFWRKNLVNLRAHQVFDSPLYRNSNYQSQKFYRSGLKGIGLHLARLFAHNPFTFLIILPPLFGFPLDNYYWWGLAMLILTFLTTFFNPLLFFGEGFKYLKLAAFPLSLCFASYFLGQNNILFNGALTGTILFCTGLMFYLHYYTTVGSKEDVTTTPPDLMGIMALLVALPGERVLCFPSTISDTVAYHTRKKTLWGGHGYGFKNLEPFFPILEKPVEHFLEKYDISYLLLDKQYVKFDEFRFEEKAVELLKENGRFSLYQVHL